MRSRRWIIFLALAVGFFFIALNADIYNLTSPPTLTWHVALRKAYSIIAFTLVGAAFVRASGATIQTSTIVLALYSGAIEIGQHLVDGHEPLIWNLLDVVCGAVGGAFGALVPTVRER